MIKEFVIAVIFVSLTIWLIRHLYSRYVGRTARREQQVMRERRTYVRATLSNILAYPNSTPRDPERIAIVRSAEIVVTKDYGDSERVVISAEPDVVLPLYPDVQGETTEQIIERTVQQLDYWLNKMPDNEIVGVEKKRVKIGDVI